MERTIGKAAFKAKVLEYLRSVEETGTDLVITDHGRPVARVSPFRFDPEAGLEALRGSVLRFDDPTEPVGAEDWEALS